MILLHSLSPQLERHWYTEEFMVDPRCPGPNMEKECTVFLHMHMFLFTHINMDYLKFFRHMCQIWLACWLPVRVTVAVSNCSETACAIQVYALREEGLLLFIQLPVTSAHQRSHPSNSHASAGKKSQVTHISNVLFSNSCLCLTVCVSMYSWFSILMRLSCKTFLTLFKRPLYRIRHWI